MEVKLLQYRKYYMSSFLRLVDDPHVVDEDFLPFVSDDTLYRGVHRFDVARTAIQ
jgi:hypothetical protein